LIVPPSKAGRPKLEPPPAQDFLPPTSLPHTRIYASPSPNVPPPPPHPPPDRVDVPDVDCLSDGERAATSTTACSSSSEPLHPSSSLYNSSTPVSRIAAAKLPASLRHREHRNVLRTIVNVYAASDWQERKDAFTTVCKAGTFEGACIDTGCFFSCSGLKQAKAYCHDLRIPFILRPSKRRFRFGSSVRSSLGQLLVQLPARRDKPILLSVDVVDLDVPLLIGLDFLDSQGLYWNSVTNKLVHHATNTSVPTIRRAGHGWIEWIQAQWFTRAELARLHKSFYHTSPDKLYQILKRWHPDQLEPGTLAVLQDIARRCDPCQRLQPRPGRYQVSLPADDGTFNRKVAMDLVWFNKSPALHVVDVDTSFGAAVFLKAQTTQAVWESFLTCWVNIYTGYPDSIHVDSGAQLVSANFEHLCEQAGIRLEISPIESHNSLGRGERYHSYVRRLFHKIKLDNPQTSDAFALSCSIKAVNDSAGPDGLVPSILVFGVAPRLPIGKPQGHPSNVERIRTMRSAMDEYKNIIGQERIRRAMSNAHKQQNHIFESGELVLVYRDKHRDAKGPYRVVDVQGKVVYVDYSSAEPRKSFSPAQLRPYLSPTTATNSLLVDLHSAFRTVNAERKRATPQVLLTEQVLPKDARAASPEMIDARWREITNLFHRGTFRVRLEKDLPPHANIMSGRFVLTIKDNNNTTVYKARYVMQGYADQDKPFLVHDVANTRPHSIRLIVALAAIFHFPLVSHDIVQAYLQSSEAMRREIFLRPKRQDGAYFDLRPGEVLELLRPLYGLADAGEFWQRERDRHFHQDLDLRAATGDPALFFKRVEHQLIGVVGCYVDDTLWAGTPALFRMLDATKRKFASPQTHHRNLTFAGVDITTASNVLRLSQNTYLTNLKPLKPGADISSYRSRRAKLAWLTLTRPDVSCALSLAAQVTAATMNDTHVALLNKILKHLQATPSTSLPFPSLNLDTTRIAVYCDASFANRDDLSSQLGYLVFLTDNTGRANLIHFSSTKSRRVVRSVLTGETMAVASGFDWGFLLQHDLLEITGRKLPIVVYTDSKSLFDCITAMSATAERRLLIDITTVREAYTSEEISNVGLLASANNPADALTKIARNAVLERFLNTGMLTHPVQQWMVRPKNGVGSTRTFRASAPAATA
jgi:hypothetical protein